MDAHLRTNGVTVAAANFGSEMTLARGPGHAIIFVGVPGPVPSGANWSVAAPFEDANLGGIGRGLDPLFFTEVYGPGEVTLTCTDLEPARTYLVQVLHGEPRDMCCMGFFRNNEFTTRLPGGAVGPRASVPGFFLGNGLPGENPPNPQDYAVVTAQVSGVQSLTYVMRDASGSRGPSIAGFQLRMMEEPVRFTVVVNHGDNPVGDRLIDGHLRTNGTLRVAANFGSQVGVGRGPGGGINFAAMPGASPFLPGLFTTVGPEVDTSLGSLGQLDELFYSEIYGPGEVTLTCSDLDPARVYLLQVLHGEPRECCAGLFSNNTFTTRLAGGANGPVWPVPAFQLGNGIANGNPGNGENPPAADDLVVVTGQFSGVESVTYVMRDAEGATRGPSIAGFQLRELATSGAVTVAADGGAGSLRQAVALARPGDILRFAPALSGKTIALAGGPITLDKELVLDASALPRGLLINGSRLGRIFNVTADARVELVGLTLTNGWVTGEANPGGAGGDGVGGGIWNAGTLTLRRCVVANCTVVGGDGDVAGFARGGGIYNSGMLVMDRCTLSGNAAWAGRLGTAQGGGLANDGRVTMRASTVTGNRADGGQLGRWGQGGGIYSVGPTTNEASTISGNVARGGGLPAGGGAGGGIFNEGLLLVHQSTVGGNVAEAGDGISSSAMAGGIHNIGQLALNQSTVSENVAREGLATTGGATSGGVFSAGGLLLFNTIVAGNRATDSANLSGAVLLTGTNLLSGDPGLGPLGQYGGPTATMPPLAGSPAIDAGSDDATNSYAVDQAGWNRLTGGRVDIGAVESPSRIAGPFGLVVPKTTVAAAGTDLTLSAGVLGSATLTCQWFFNKKAIPGANGRTLTLTNVQRASGGAYQVRVDNGYGVATSAVATVRVLLRPAIKVQPVNTVALAGRNTSLRVAATGTARLTYQWRRNGLPIPGATNAIYKIAAAASSDTGDYTVLIRNAVGDVVSTKTQLIVKPAIITQQPASLAVPLGQRAVFSVRATSAYPLNYRWRKDATELPGPLGATLTLTNVQVSDAGTYSVVLANEAGEVTSADAVLTVTGAGLAPAAISRAGSGD